MEHNSTTPDAYIQLLLIAGFLIPAILFLLTQQNTLRSIRPENRQMHPGLVWLQLIPFLGSIWQFFVVTKIARSIGLEMQGWTEDSIVGFANAEAVDASGRKPTLAIGITYCSLQTLVMANGLYTAVTRVRHSENFETALGFVAIAMIVCWIIYWVKLAGAKRNLKRSALALA